MRIAHTVTAKGFAFRGHPLGRPRQVSEATAEQVQQDKQQGRDDATARMAVEGKLGQGKRRFGLGRLMAKLAVTSEVMIQASFLVMNLEHLLARGVFSWLSSRGPNWRSTWNGLLVARWLKMNTDCSERISDGLAASVARIPQLAA